MKKALGIMIVLLLLSTSTAFAKEYTIDFEIVNDSTESLNWDYIVHIDRYNYGEWTVYPLKPGERLKWPNQLTHIENKEGAGWSFNFMNKCRYIIHLMKDGSTKLERNGDCVRVERLGEYSYRFTYTGN